MRSCAAAARQSAGAAARRPALCARRSASSARDLDEALRAARHALESGAAPGRRRAPAVETDDAPASGARRGLKHGALDAAAAPVRNGARSAASSCAASSAAARRRRSGSRFDPRLEREVAVKLLRPDGDAAAVGDWLHEARNVSRLTHPHIVPVFEADVHDGQPYLVFEYVAGPTLAERIRARRDAGARGGADCCSACSTRWRRRMPPGWCTAT